MVMAELLMSCDADLAQLKVSRAAGDVLIMYGDRLLPFVPGFFFCHARLSLTRIRLRALCLLCSGSSSQASCTWQQPRWPSSGARWRHLLRACMAARRPCHLAG